MKFLVDENIGTTIVKHLRSSGHDIHWISEISAGASDQSIIRTAYEMHATIITYDQDFGELVFFHQEQHTGVLLLRISTENTQYHIQAIENFLATHSEEEIQGNFWKIDERFL